MEPRMSTSQPSIAAIESELTGLLKTQNPATVSMTQPQFLAYARDQITLAKSDSDPKPRLTALEKLVSIAKAQSWEDTTTIPVSVYAGDLSVQATSAQAEQIAEHPGLGVAVPGPQGAPTSGGFESGAGPAGPTGNTVRPEGRWMPDAAPQSTPTGGAEGFIAKAA